MNATGVMASVREMLIVVLALGSPFLLTAILSSFVVGVFQAGTRINDLTLSFVPRFVAVLLVAYFTAAWAFAQMTGYIERSATAMRIFSG
jgi:flagellar biosynthesis protein FliQ